MKKLLTFSVFCALAMSVLSCATDSDNNSGRKSGGGSKKNNNRCDRCPKCLTELNVSR